MKTDAALKLDVQAELDWDPAVNATQIGVAVKDGVVTLTGHLETYAEKYAAQRALRRIAGVKAIALELDVKLAPDHRRSDTEIAQAAEHALKWNTLVPDAVRVTVEKGRVSLSGEVEWDYQRRAAETSVRTLTGVVNVNNLVTIRPRVLAGDLRKRIGDALKRQVDREVSRMVVEVSGSKVTLSGDVNSWHEREAAYDAAWSAQGVTAVVNKLDIA